MASSTSNGTQHISEMEGHVNDGFSPDMKVVNEKGAPDNQEPLPARISNGEERLPDKLEFPLSEKWRILKNIAAVSCAFMVQFTAFQGTANLQSSVNAKDGLGTVSLCTIYAALVVSSIFIPTFVIKRLTVKWTLCISMLCYMPYIAAQFYPRFYTLVPAGVILGMGAAPMWAAKATYLTQVGGIYAKLTDQAVDGIIVRFFGFFFLAWQTAELWGNLISSLVLSSGVHGTKIRGGTSPNISHTESLVDHCGANFCVMGNHNNDNLERPPDSEIYEISAIYLGCILMAVAIMAFLVDPLSRYGEARRRSNAEDEISGVQLLYATAFQLKKIKQQLLIPITLWIGMEQAFIGAEFTQAYVSCALGIHFIGYVMICFGIVNAICSLLFGSLMKYTGRAPIIILGFLVHLALIIILIIWKPHPDSPWIFFVISGMWGVGDAVWQTQVNGLYGTLFRRNKEAAFSNYRLWESAGFVIAYAYSTQLCAIKKLYALLSVLIIGFIGYLLVELMQKRKALKAKKQALKTEKEIKEEPMEEEEIDDEKDDLDDDIVVTHM